MYKSNSCFIIMVFAMALSGCMPINIVKGFFKPLSASAQQDRDYTIDIQSFHIPATGEKVTILRPNTEKEMEVVFGEVYVSASGTLCAHFTTTEDAGKNNINGLACMDGNKKWLERMLELKILGPAVE